MEETSFDVIVVGTGLVESVVAGAVARAGKRVLHLDKNDYYGASIANFDLLTYSEALLWAEQHPASSPIAPTTSPTLVRLDTRPEFTPPFTCFRNHGEAADLSAEHAGAERLSSPCSEVSSAAASSPPEELLRIAKQFLVDSFPLVLWSKGPAVSAIARSRVSRYLDFKSVGQCSILLMPSADACSDESTEHDTKQHIPKLVPIPDSKASLFNDKLLSLAEKRVLMRFIQCAAAFPSNNEPSVASSDPSGASASSQPSNVTAVEEVTLGSFLETPPFHTISPLVRDIIVHALTASEPRGLRAPLSASFSAVRSYASSVGIHSSTPFLLPIYGACEIAQAFCRMAAVYGATYMLRRAASEVWLNSSTQSEQNDTVDADHYPLRVRVFDTPLSERGPSYRSVVSSSSNAPQSSAEVAKEQSGESIHSCSVSPIDPKASAAIESANIKETIYSCKWAVVPESLVLSSTKFVEPLTSNDRFLQRCVVILSRPHLLEGVHSMWIVCPPIAPNSSAVRFLQIDSGLSIAPRDYCIIYGEIAETTECAKAYLKTCMDALLSVCGVTSQIMWCSYANVRLRAPLLVPLTSDKNDFGVLSCGDVRDVIDLGGALEEAEKIFHVICGAEATFLEPMPEPEDVFAEEAAVVASTAEQSQAVSAPAADANPEQIASTLAIEAVIPPIANDGSSSSQVLSTDIPQSDAPQIPSAHSTEAEANNSKFDT